MTKRSSSPLLQAGTKYIRAGTPMLEEHILDNAHDAPAFKDAIARGRCMTDDAMTHLTFRHEAQHTLDQPSSWITSNANVVRAWCCEYRGKYHEVMLRNINSMKRHGATSVPLIQSSGAGKSRMVDEQANLVFTIPFNLRHPRERASGAFPPEDTEVWEYLCNVSGVRSIQIGVDRSKLFFGHLFSVVTSEVQEVSQVQDKVSPHDLARCWRIYLLQGDKRSQLYAKVIEACKNDEARLDSAFVANFAQTKLKALVEALNSVCAFPEASDVKVVLYFDEAHELHCAIPGDKQGNTLYDCMWLSLENLKSSSIFAIFISTQSSMVALSDNTAQLQRTEALPGPITETPFDCHPDFPLRVGELTLEDLGELTFLARFGRPLFWTMIEAANGSCTGTTMELARLKLVFDYDIHKRRHSDIAMLAVLDVLITIDYDTRNESARKVEMEMVASHMRTSFSEPGHREYIFSGYPSEPFLAEAALRQMYHYQKDGFIRMISILKEGVDQGLVDSSRRGELVMRMILSNAYMNATAAEQAQPNFSKGCSFHHFLKALIADSFHTLVLRSYPGNNAAPSCTLEDAFENAVVRFTHFIKASDDFVVTTRTMVSAFLRGSALICYDHQNGIDIVIPILLDKRRKLAEPSMSALLVQVKRGQQAGADNIDHKALGFFPNMVPTSLEDSRPYVTLFAGLDVDPPVNQPADMLADDSKTCPCPRTVSKLTYPRYSIRAYGCSDAAWKVIKSYDRDMYKAVLGTNDIFEDHPRQDETSVRLLRGMMPFWYENATWIVQEPMERMKPSAAVEVGYYDSDDESMEGEET